MNAKASTNPEEVQVEKDTAKKGRDRTQGVKVGKNLKKGVKQDSHNRPTTVTSGEQASKGNIASQTDLTTKSKKETQEKEAPQEGVGNTRKEPPSSRTAAQSASPKAKSTKKIESPRPKRHDRNPKKAPEKNGGTYFFLSTCKQSRKIGP